MSISDELMHPCYAAERGLVDDVIDRARGLAMLCDKRRREPLRKHGNVPL